MKGREIGFRTYRQEIFLNGSLFGSAREIYGRRVYFALDGFFLKPSHVVFDLGANAGVFTTLAAKLSRQVIAVEAQSEFIAEIERNLERNGCRSKVRVEWGLVGSRSGLFSDINRLRASSHFGVMPPVLDMLDIMWRNAVERIDFLKIDIEGGEYDLLMGDSIWLSQVSRIAMEVHTRWGNPAALVDGLERRGFRVTLVNPYGEAVPVLTSETGYMFAASREALAGLTGK